MQASGASESSPAPRRLWRAARIVALVVGTWLVLAYFVLPLLWRHYEHEPGLAEVPMVTRDAQGIPGDPINVAIVGAEGELEGAMRLAGWTRAAALSLGSDLAIAESVVLDRPDHDAPVSDLFLFGRRQDLAFEKEVGESAKRRHHVRFWHSPVAGERPLWIGSATFDRSAGLSGTTGQITHHIAPDVDADRDGLMDDLAHAGQLTTIFQVTGVGPTLAGRNAGGDRYFTDGEVWVGVLTIGNAVRAGPPGRLVDPLAVQAKDRVWSLLRPLLD